MLISQKLKQKTGSTSGIHPCLLLVYRRNVDIPEIEAEDREY
jgi:ribonucleotide reductase alpha subunit